MILVLIVFKCNVFLIYFDYKENVYSSFREFDTVLKTFTISQQRDSRRAFLEFTPESGRHLTCDTNNGSSAITSAQAPSIREIVNQNSQH